MAKNILSLKRFKYIVIIFVVILVVFVAGSFYSQSVKARNIEILVSTSDLPKSLKIPVIDVKANILHLGTDKYGYMESPKNPGEVSWYRLGVKPGEIGSAVIAGHYGWENNTQAAFDNLNKIKIGDHIYMEKENGEIVTFIVRQIRIYNDSEIASSVFISTDDKSHLNLITCVGPWDKIDQSYPQRLVVFTDMDSGG